MMPPWVTPIRVTSAGEAYALAAWRCGPETSAPQLEHARAPADTAVPQRGQVGVGGAVIVPQYILPIHQTRTDRVRKSLLPPTGVARPGARARPRPFRAGGGGRAGPPPPGCAGHTP